ncbi:MAG: pilus assembly protein, partial [Fimbriimonadaceae bacterium]|nr:pilus assembly protein [Alphaproteobacteria bacterium]
MNSGTWARLIGRSLRRSGVFVSSRNKINEFNDGETGATAVEFAILAFPFLMLLLAVIEVGIVFFATQIMETGVEGAARLIRTGQAQQFSQAQFKLEVCDRISALFDCNK